MSNSRILSKIPSDLANNVGKILSVNTSGEIAPETNHAWIKANSAFDTANTKFNSSGGIVSGDVTITGNVTVQGTTTTLNVDTLTVEDKNIVLANVATPSNVTADGAGITVLGATDKTWNWVNTSSSWTSSENIDLASGKSFKIAGADVLTGSSLGSGITGSSLTSVGTLSSLGISGNLTFSGTGQRITGDFSNATVANRLAFQTSTVNGSTTIMAIPNGSGTNAQLLLRSSSTVADDSFGQVVLVGGIDFRIASGISGTGTYLPMTFYTGGSERVKIDTSGNVGIGTSSLSSQSKLTVYADASPSSTTYALWLRGGSAGVANDGGGIAFSTAAASAIANPSLAATAIRSLNTYGSESNGEEGDLAFYTNRRTGANTYTGLTERLRIDSSGNVGIGLGATAAQAKLDVGGALWLRSGVTAGAVGIFTADATSGTNGITLEASFASGGYGPIKLKTDSYERVNISGSSVVFRQLNSSTNTSVSFNTTIQNALTLDSSGKLGVGTNAPTEKLEVLGGAVASRAASSSTTAGIWAQATDYWSGATYNGVGLLQYGSASTGTTAGLSNANLGTLQFQNGSAGLILTNGMAPLVFGTLSTERLRIDSAGNVGIGTVTKPSSIALNIVGKDKTTGDATPLFNFKQASTDTSLYYAGARFEFSNSSATNNNFTVLSFLGANGYDLAAIWTVNKAHTAGAVTGDLVFGTANAASASTERLRIDSSGNVHVGRSGIGSGTLGNTFGLCSGGVGYNEAINTTSDTGLALWYINRQSSTGAFFEFRYATGKVGDITTNGTTTAYNQSSDYRLKDNIQPLQNALSRVAMLKPSKYIWKSDQSEGEGFIAHELQEVVPQAVTGEKDGEQMQGVDYGKLTPLLAAAIQELHAEIEQLKQSIRKR